jgi:hypothetical protein
MIDLLPQLDNYIRIGTGRDWTVDDPVHPLAKAAARILLVRGYEDPGALEQSSALEFGARSLMVQLAVIALQYKVFLGRNGAGGCYLPGVRRGDSVSGLVGLVGMTGDQSALFETVVTVDDQIQQVSTSNLTNIYFRARFVSLGDL